MLCQTREELSHEAKRLSRFHRMGRVADSNSDMLDWDQTFRHLRKGGSKLHSFLPPLESQFVQPFSTVVSRRAKPRIFYIIKCTDRNEK